jgi:hypothetical protein
MLVHALPLSYNPQFYLSHLNFTMNLLLAAYFKSEKSAGGLRREVSI